MRAAALALLLAARAAAAPPPYAGPAGNPKELQPPDRYDLPGSKGEPAAISSEVARLDGKALLAIIRDPKDERRVEAVIALTLKIDQLDRGEDAKYSWAPIADSVAAMDHLFAKVPPGVFRRWAVYRLFAPAAGQTRSMMTLVPGDRKVDAWWERLDALRARGLRDGDPRLAEFFERYAEDPEAPRWREAKKAAGAARDRLLLARPDAKDFSAKVWRLQETVEDSQLVVLRRFEARLDGMTGVPPERRARLKAVERSTTEHRLRIGWANMIPRIIAESFSLAEARAHGFEPAPVLLGWPAVPAR